MFFTAPERAVSWLWLIFLFLVWLYCVVRFWHTGGCTTHSTTLQHWLNFRTVGSGGHHFGVSELLFPHLESKIDSVHCLPQGRKSRKQRVETTLNSSHGIHGLVLDDSLGWIFIFSLLISHQTQLNSIFKKKNGFESICGETEIKKKRKQILKRHNSSLKQGCLWRTVHTSSPSDTVCSDVCCPTQSGSL